MDIPAFHQTLRDHLPDERLITDAARRFALGTDASFYRLTPQLIVQVDNETELQTVLAAAREYQVPLTFRAAGTSLSGQAVTDAVLVTLTPNWRDCRIEPLGERVHLQPGLIGGLANRKLAPFGRKIGPDPASINACQIGGIVANNASGMCCGTRHNSYHTLAGMRVVLADGGVLDSLDPESVRAFRRSHPRLLKGLSELSLKLNRNEALAERVRHKYRLKNTTGYGLNALLDFDDPIDILTHLMVGSEGTLGFVSEVSLNTVPDHPHRAAIMVGFEHLTHCAQTVSQLKAAPVDAVELLDSRAVRAVSHMDGLPSFARRLPDSGGLLLLDVRGESLDQLDEHCQAVQQILDEAGVNMSTGFTRDSRRIDAYWTLRKGTFPAVGAHRAVGTTAVIEDVAFPVEKLADGVAMLQALFDRHGYDEAIIFGHALEGNLHFVFTQGFDDPAEIRRYEAFMADVADAVTGELDGSLKAEHGTGRNMAPFVKQEWGKDAYSLMKAIKKLFDPKGLLNPGVILNDDPQAHLQNLKLMPAADRLVDACIECGFCEPVCPSREWTLTPRQRISLHREMQRQRREEGLADGWQDRFEHQAIDSCAATGLCQAQCPVGINTGELVLKLRAERNHRYIRLAKSMGRHYAALASVTRAGLWAANSMQRLTGPKRLERWSAAIRNLSGGRTPLWLSTLPGPARPVYAPNRATRPSDREVLVYWASCVSQTFGAAIDEKGRGSLPASVLNVLRKAGLNVVMPQPTRGLCCGQPFQSKGHFSVAEQQRQELVDELWEMSSGGRFPVLADTSPCSLRVREAASDRGIQFYDSVDFIDRFLLDRLAIQPDPQRVAVHTTCSVQRQGIAPSLARVLDKLTPDWIQPDGMACCGFAGDKGFTQPELNASALRGLDNAVSGCAYGISTSRTCEIGLSRHSGLTYYSLFEVLDRLSTVREDAA
ncbi:FAD-binding and (Fe-S)-binding domain-containing protein [Saccharospirillum mangrovi]|uniref:FAD-binding and (Fe-S)-binding domain-containing protein n=1 Tax=Saccharospirillum mangrovi TaxID=2161747 RepID=UPI001E2BBBE9|nr:FAD-binding and (Fe-S)-binding domain-containing protein [Saccharospirillum mangrovi]